MRQGIELSVIGWREWVELPLLGINQLKAKIDTGARTSVLHAFEVNLYNKNQQKMVGFSIHPMQYSKEKILHCESELYGMRWVADSGGHKELRPVIKTDIKLGLLSWSIEITLTNRDDMRFRFLLGRTAIPKNTLINTSRSYLVGKSI